MNMFITQSTWQKRLKSPYSHSYRTALQNLLVHALDFFFYLKKLSKRQIKYDCSLGSFTDRHTKWSTVTPRVHTYSCFISQSLPLGVSSHTQKGKFSIMLGQNWLPRNIESVKMISPWLAVMASVNVGVTVSNGFRARHFPKELFLRESSEEVGV